MTDAPPEVLYRRPTEADYPSIVAVLEE